MRVKNIYIAGRMAGKDQKQIEMEWLEAEKKLRADGWTVVSPVELEKQYVAQNKRKPTYREILVRDLEFLGHHCQAIYFLPGWETSLGARAEHALAVALQANEPNFEIIYEN